MPSDPSGVQPSGVLIRPAPDFFDDQLQLISAFTYDASPPVGENYTNYSLFNNAKSGLVFKVYGVTAFAEGGGGFGFFYSKTQLGSLVSNSQSLNPNTGTGYGQLFAIQRNVAMGVENPDIPAQIAGIFAASGFDSQTTLSPFPLAIIPVGYYLTCVMLESSPTNGIGFWYQMANE